MTSLPSPISRVFVRALSINARIGLFERERDGPQPLVVDVELTLDTMRFENESLTGTVDYNIVARYARELAVSHVDLVETYAERLAELCLALQHVVAVRIAIEKPRAVPYGMAGVEIVRVRG